MLVIANRSGGGVPILAPNFTTDFEFDLCAGGKGPAR